MEPHDPRSLPPGRTAPDRQLPDGRSKVQRVSQHTRGLVDDVKAWVELKLKQTQLDIEESVEAKIRQAAIGAVLGLLALLALVFGLTAFSLGVGEWLGHPAWGYLVTTVLLLVVAGILRALQPRLTQVHRQAAVDEDKLMR